MAHLRLPRFVAGGHLAAFLMFAAPLSLAAPLRLHLLDDRGSTIGSSIKVCVYRGVETICFEQSPYEVPTSMRDFDSLTAEGPSHGPIHLRRIDLRHEGTDELSVRIPRKAELAIQGLPADPITLSLYGSDDATFRKPAFRFENVKAMGLLIPAQRFVLALSDGRNAPDLQLLSAKPGSQYHIDYHRRPGWSLLFRSVATERAPVDGAAASLLSAAAPGKERELAKTVSDRDGLGTISGVTESYVTISVSAAGYLKTSAPGITAGRGTFTFREMALERGGYVKAEVTLDGTPATGSACQIASTQQKRDSGSRLPTAEVLAEVKVSKSGICETPRMAHGDYVFRVIPKDSGNSDDQSITLAEDQALDLEVKLRRYGVSGTVRRGEKPEAGALVFVTNDADFPGFPAGRSAPPDPLKLETDDEGRYDGTVWRSGRYTFTVASRSLAAAGTKTVDVGDDGAVVDFQLNEGDVSGVVVDQQNKPVPNAWVNLSFRVPGGWENRYGYGDEDGKFSFPLQEGGRLKLMAGKDGYKNSDEIELNVSPDQAPPPQMLVVSHLDTIDGHILWPDGNGAAGIGVATYDAAPGRAPINAGSVLTEPDGHFSVAKASGSTTRVFVTGLGCPLQVADIANDGQDVRLRCATISSSLEITMKKTDRTGVQDERVLLRWNGILIPREILSSHLIFLGMPDGTDSGGRLTIVALPPGNYDVFLQDASSEATISEGLQYGFISTVTLAPMETAELEVRLQ
ncbi:MAG TPA: carboxypeptidase-like regulatory domain-containing protein [Thermoanaerobaculia bacterium]|nr:carboxypeptidase-like regulatory domain-containing protein [Thermoanaerobaculia bacterium]